MTGSLWFVAYLALVPETGDMVDAHQGFKLPGDAMKWCEERSQHGHVWVDALLYDEGAEWDPEDMGDTRGEKLGGYDFLAAGRWGEYETVPNWRAMVDVRPPFLSEIVIKDSGNTCVGKLAQPYVGKELPAWLMAICDQGRVVVLQVDGDVLRFLDDFTMYDDARQFALTGYEQRMVVGRGPAPEPVQVPA